MSENLNITGNLIEFINNIGQYWTRKKGLFLFIVLEFILLAFLWDKFGHQTIITGGFTVLGLVIVTTIVWFITSKRILFRSGALVLLWLALSLACATLFCLYIYPFVIQSGPLDILYIQIWGTVVVFCIIVFIGLVVDCFVFKGKKLMIVFAVNNESVVVEKSIRASIEPAVQHIQDSDSNIKLGTVVNC